MKRFFEFITLQTLVITAIAVVSTYLCIEYRLAAAVPTSLLGIAVIFPIVFAINAAFRRREAALGWLSDLKAASMSLFFAYRDWIPPHDGSRMETEFSDAAGSLAGVMDLVCDYLTRHPGTREEGHQRLLDIYDRFGRISKLNERAREAGVPANEVSRANQYLSHIMRDFEKVRTIREYRTPMALRGYWQVCLHLFPVLFAPAYANLALKYYLAVGYGTAVLFSVVLVGLDNIQERLEDPFDQDSVDDIRLDFATSYGLRMESLAGSGREG